MDTALIFWEKGDFGETFNRLLEGLEAKRFIAISEKKTTTINKYGKNIYMYEGVDFYKKNIDKKIPLDDNILKAMAPYSETAMKIVNRFRRSYILGDRFEDVKNLYYVLLTYWNDLILKNKVGCFVFEADPHIPLEYIPYALCKVYNIPVMFTAPLKPIAGRKNNYLIRSDINELFPKFEKEYEKNEILYKNNEIYLSPELEAFFSEFRDNDKKKAIKRITTQVSRFNIGYLFAKVKECFNRVKIYSHRGDLPLLWKKFKYILSMRITEKTFLSQIERLEELTVEGERYVLFLLHEQPEANTLPGGGFFVEQLLAIQLLANNLPDDVKLYVKEHPSYWKRKGALNDIREYRSLEYYKILKNFKNVRLIRHEQSSIELMERCVAVATINGTVSMEAVFKNIPTIMFGNNPFSFFKGIYKVKTSSQCRKAIERIMRNNPIKYNDKDIRIFLKTLEPYVFERGADYILSIKSGAIAADKNDYDNEVEKMILYYKQNFLEK